VFVLQAGSPIANPQALIKGSTKANTSASQCPAHR